MKGKNNKIKKDVSAGKSGPFKITAL